MNFHFIDKQVVNFEKWDIFMVSYLNFASNIYYHIKLLIKLVKFMVKYQLFASYFIHPHSNNIIYFKSCQF
jgi:hypothetical protein